MGDFNLDAGMNFKRDYTNIVQLEMRNEFALKGNLLQIIEFTTWSRIINGNLKQSLIDHLHL